MENPSALQLSADGIIPALGVSLEDLETYVTHVREGQYLLVAGITLLIYDYFCTLEEEISFVWGQAPRLVAAKILFALNRYIPVFTLILRFSVYEKAMYNAQVSAIRLSATLGDDLCTDEDVLGVSFRLGEEVSNWSLTRYYPTFSCNFPLLSATGFSGVINVAVVEVVLLLRVWVLYARKKWIGVALWLFYLVCLGLALAVKYLQPHTNLPFVIAPTYGNTGCSKVVPGEMFFIYGVVTIAESVFFTMLLAKAYQTSRNSSHTPILTALLKQGTFYYFIVLAILTVTMFAPFSDSLYWPIAIAFPIVPIVSIACNRLILSLRGMVFSQNAVRASGFGISGSGSQSHSGSGSGSGNYHPRLPPTKYVHSARNIHPIGGTRKSAAFNADKPATIVTFTDDWRDQNDHHQLDDSVMTLDIHPASPFFEQRQQQLHGGGRVMEESWLATESGDKLASVHPMVPIRRG